MQSTGDAEKKKKKKKKKSEKSTGKTTGKAPTSPPSPTNASEESAPRDEDDTRSVKRKRDPEPEQQKVKKTKNNEDENDLNGFNTPAPNEDARDQNADSSPPSQPSPKATPTSEPSAPPPKKGREKKLRGPRIGGKDNDKKIGFFTADEVNLLEGHKVLFCNTHNFANDTSRFDAMVQHSDRSGVDFPCPPEICTKPNFWAEIYTLIPSRDRRSVYRFMRRHFQDSKQKAHDWTPEQDKELIELMELHPNKFAHIAKLLGRSDDDVTQRWKNRLQHRDKQNRGAWTEPELRGLQAAVQTAWKVNSMQAPNLAGKDVYQMDEKHVAWGAVSDSMNNARSRQQCADKWRKIRKHVLTLRATTDPEAEFDPVDSARRSTRWGDNNMLKAKSHITVKDDDDETDIDVQQIPASTPGSGKPPKVGFMDFIKSLSSRVANDPTSAPSSQPQPQSIDRVGDNEKPSEADVNDVTEATEPTKTKKSKKRKHSEVAPVAETELPSPVKSQTGEKDKTEKSEKKRRKKERKEREKREREEAEQAAAKEAEEAAAKEAEKTAAKRAKKAAKEAEKAAAKEAEEAAAKAAERAEYKAAKKARKAAKKEKKLRQSLAEADDAAPVATPSPKKSKKSKHRQSTSEPNGSTAAEPKQPESSKKSKKSKKSKRDRESAGDGAHGNGDSSKSKKIKKERSD